MFGDSIYELLFILALIIIAADFFIASDVLSLIAYIILAYLVVHAANLPLMYGVLLGIGVWFIVAFLHYTVFKKIISKVCNEIIAPSVMDGDPLARYVGRETTVVSMDGRNMLRLEGDLIAFKHSEKFDDGDIVEVTAFTEGILEVVKKQITD